MQHEEKWLVIVIPHLYLPFCECATDPSSCILGNNWRYILHFTPVSIIMDGESPCFKAADSVSFSTGSCTVMFHIHHFLHSIKYLV